MSADPSGYTLRSARRSDVEAIVRLTLCEAREAEGADLDPDAVRRGVEAGFSEPPAAAYWIAESEDGRVVASASAVKEWSNFNGGWYWWVQSLFVDVEHRGRGLAKALLHELTAAAAAAGAIDLRLYAHGANVRALGLYRRCGFDTAPYVIMRKPLPRGE